MHINVHKAGEPLKLITMDNITHLHNLCYNLNMTKEEFIIHVWTNTVNSDCIEVIEDGNWRMI